MNVESERFRSASSFYAVASSSPLSELVDERMAAIYELGLEYLQLSPGAGATPDEQQRFETGLVDLMRRQQLYFEKPDGVGSTRGVIYHAKHNRTEERRVGNECNSTVIYSWFPYPYKKNIIPS